MGKAALCNDSGVQRTPGSMARSLWTGETSPMPPCRLCVGTELRIILDLYYILWFMFRTAQIVQWQRILLRMQQTQETWTQFLIWVSEDPLE